jgi:DNA-binding SARP family transcriptional activator
VTLHVRLFGSFELERDGRPVERFASRKSGELFAYLALNRRGLHTREHLAGVFWGESAEERARHALNTTLWRINRVLEPAGGGANQRGYLRVTPQHIGFNTASDTWLDVAEFESRCELAEQAETPVQRAALYSQAISFYRADLLVDCYEDWCIVERERLQGLYLRALARLMAHNSAQAEYDLAIDCARRILGCDPLREEVHRDLMRLHLTAGQPAAALRQYRLCEELLRQELAVEPAPETRALLAPILGANSTSGRKPIARMPAAASGDLAIVATKIQELSAACDAARVQLRDAMALLGELTAELEAETRDMHAPPPLRQAVGGKA